MTSEFMAAINRNALSDIEKILHENPSKKNWERVQSALKQSGAKYYEVVYAVGGIKREDDLRKSIVRIFDSKRKLLGELPVFSSEKKDFDGALYYLRKLVQRPRA